MRSLQSYHCWASLWSSRCICVYSLCVGRCLCLQRAAAVRAAALIRSTTHPQFSLWDRLCTRRTRFQLPPPHPISFSNSRLLCSLCRVAQLVCFASVCLCICFVRGPCGTLACSWNEFLLVHLAARCQSKSLCSLHVTSLCLFDMIGRIRISCSYKGSSYLFANYGLSLSGVIELYE